MKICKLMENIYMLVWLQASPWHFHNNCYNLSSHKWPNKEKYTLDCWLIQYMRNMSWSHVRANLCCIVKNKITIFTWPKPYEWARKMGSSQSNVHKIRFCFYIFVELSRSSDLFEVINTILQSWLLLPATVCSQNWTGMRLLGFQSLHYQYPLEKIRVLVPSLARFWSLPLCLSRLQVVLISSFCQTLIVLQFVLALESGNVSVSAVLVISEHVDMTMPLCVKTENSSEKGWWDEALNIWRISSRFGN